MHALPETGGFGRAGRVESVGVSESTAFGSAPWVHPSFQCWGQRGMSPLLAPQQALTSMLGLCSWSRMVYLESAHIRMLQRELQPAQGQQWCCSSVPVEGALPTH